jgi:hypothetical protein
MANAPYFEGEHEYNSKKIWTINEETGLTELVIEVTPDDFVGHAVTENERNLYLK